MTMMSPLKRGARAANQPTPRRLNDERNNPVKLLRRAKLLMLSAAVALAALAAGMTTAVPAYAKSTASISAYGGPGEIWVTGSGFPAYATVRIEALSNPGLSYVGYAQYIPADGSGNITGGFTQTSGTLSPTFTGPVYVLADSPAGTVGATTVVNQAPQFLSNGTGQTDYTGTTTCGSVNAEIAGFERFYSVRVELLTDKLTVLDTKYVTADSIGDVSLSSSPSASGPPLSTRGYTGGAYIIADEYGGYPPAPATVGYHLTVC